MQRITVAAVLLAASVTMARAETVWIGNVFVSFVSGPALCTSTFGVGDFFRAIFRPRGNTLGNGNDSHLATVGSRSSVVMRIATDDFRQGVNYAPLAVSSSLTIGTTLGGGVTVWQQDPPALGPNTPTVKIKARFSNYFRVQGCFVELQGILLRR